MYNARDMREVSNWRLCAGHVSCLSPHPDVWHCMHIINWKNTETRITVRHPLCQKTCKRDEKKWQNKTVQTILQSCYCNHASPSNQYTMSSCSHRDDGVVCTVCCPYSSVLWTCLPDFEQGQSDWCLSYTWLCICLFFCLFVLYYSHLADIFIHSNLH